MTDTIATEIDIAAPVATVWDALTDYAAYADWNPYLVRIEGEAVAGSSITVHSRPVTDGDVMVAPVDVVSVAPYIMRWEGGYPDRNQFKGDHWFVLEAAPGGTRLKHFEHFSGSRAADILGAYRSIIAANFVRFNTALKARAESQS
jgi:hypothetical protein